MYDWAHGLEDSIEGITHSICTLEFENHRPLYDWFLDALEIHHPQQIEFARLNLTYTVMSKRKLLELVKDRHVSGWDDPRMPTLSGLRRRGFSPEAIRSFCKTIGVNKFNSTIDYALLEPASMEGQVAVVPISVGWSDLGSWSALRDERATDGEPVIATEGAARVIDIDGTDVLVYAAGDRTVATVGLDGVIVVDQPMRLATWGNDYSRFWIDLNKDGLFGSSAPEAYRVLYNKYYVDEAYEGAFIRPGFWLSKSVLWKVVDVGVIDGLLVNGSALAVTILGSVLRLFQNGLVRFYAWSIAIGITVFVLYLTFTA